MGNVAPGQAGRMIDVNIRGVLHGIAAVLPEMTARGSGRIVNIASIGALAVSPTAAVYCATKFAVRAISDGLRQEREDIRAIAIRPDAIGRAVRYALEQPGDVDVNEIVVRPTRTTQ